MNEFVKKITLRLNKITALSQLRAKYYRKPLDLNEFSGQLSIRTNRSLNLGSGPNPRNPFNAANLVAEDWRGSHYFCMLRRSTDIPDLDINKPQKV